MDNKITSTLRVKKKSILTSKASASFKVRVYKEQESLKVTALQVIEPLFGDAWFI